MIARRTSEDPSSVPGFQIYGQITTDSNGVGSFTIKGINFSSKITGICLTVLASPTSTVKSYNAHVVSISYSSTTKLTTVTIQANVIDPGNVSAYQGVVYYSAWVSLGPLPSDKGTNDTSKQEY